MRQRFIVTLVATCSFACQSSDVRSPSGESVEHVATSPTDTCGSVRLTSYTASSSGWCEFDRSAPMLPAFVRDGLTFAIAEPWNGSSYSGESGESCGECWELASLDAVRIVMVHDLCPVDGNPVCNGSHFHFDVSTETARALNLQGLDEGSVRRVPCPVNGNAHLQLLDRNEWGYVRFQVLNHRIPVRSIEYRPVDGTEFFKAERSGGAWSVGDRGEMFASNSSGGVFRMTSAQGEILEMPNPLTYDFVTGSFFDLGAQFTDSFDSDGLTCEFVPPPIVYDDEYGGIEEVRWMMNPWSSAAPSETKSGCVDDTCLRIDHLGSGAGFHIYYRQSFDPKRFSALKFSARTDSGVGTVSVTLTGDGTACETTTVPLSTAWTETQLVLSQVCATSNLINSITVYGETSLTLMLDELRFEK